MRYSFLKKAVYFAAAVTFAGLIVLVAYVFFKGIPALNLKMFEWKYTSENLSVLPSIINTLQLVLLTLIVAGPIGIFTGIYLVEYSSQESIAMKAVRLATETLSGIPSIIFGLFGMLFYNVFLGFGYSMIAGVGTVTLMILPLLIRATEEALIRVPDSQRMASFSLGAGKLRTIFRVVLPSAVPGILSGVILSIGRIVGETAALLYTLGTDKEVATGLFKSGRTLALHMYLLSSEGMHVDASYATGVILIITVLLINGISTKLSSWSFRRGSE